ncbi:hypothetical protein CGGC5_v004910 [Colletotrichum fructicola Nara gc5]|uniref:Uncharacterized protein n=1 Tax=Colletotrichum fructicola (strain Nara gc5) TaxID=1213859 RepID=A0A7J6JEB5_COLFN|nr:hypothetical protein CGGC5_v004910 [Colletotrichum fructicola Nara gc5]
MDAGSLISPPLERALSTCSTDVEIDLSLDVDLDRILFGEEWSTFEHHEVNNLPVQSGSLPTPITPNYIYTAWRHSQGIPQKLSNISNLP